MLSTFSGIMKNKIDAGCFSVPTSMTPLLALGTDRRIANLDGIK